MRQNILASQQGIKCEVIDLRTIKPLDWQAVFDSVARTGRLLALDSGFTTGSVAGEIVARVAMEQFDRLKVAPARLAMPDVPEPTSFGLTKGFYVRAADIAVKAIE
jgi:pyruvate/2-oxoglutarate/acetoin dehydrogenase E1 component